MGETLKLLLNKFTLVDLKPAVLEWGCVGQTQREIDEIFGISGTKRVVVDQILNDFEENDQPDDAVEQLALICMQKYHKKKVWSVHRLKETAAFKRHRTTSPRSFRKHLEECLTHFFDVNVCLRVKDNAYWIRVAITDSKNRVSIPYAVYYPGSPYLFLTNMRVSIAEYLLQGFLTALHCKEVEEMHLTGRCIASLAQLATHKHYKGAYAAFQASQPTDDKLFVSRQRKRKATDEDENNGIILENRQEKQRRLELSDGTFGEKTQPTLEKVTYKLETPFHSTALTPGMANRQSTFRCTVRFEGTNVLEGIRNLAEVGIAELPMKPHLSKLNCMGKNVIVLKHRAAANVTQSTVTQ